MAGIILLFSATENISSSLFVIPTHPLNHPSTRHTPPHPPTHQVYLNYF